MLDIENPLKIVVVSADSLMAENLQAFLDPQNFTVETVNPTPEGIAATRKVDPDLYIVDDTGDAAATLDTCQLIRQYSLMPIMVLSSQRKTGLVEQTLDAGADEFLVKPVPGNVLVAHMNTLARRAIAEKNAALSLVRGETKPHNQLNLVAP